MEVRWAAASCLSCGLMCFLLLGNTWVGAVEQGRAARAWRSKAWFVVKWLLGLLADAVPACGMTCPPSAPAALSVIPLLTCFLFACARSAACSAACSAPHPTSNHCLPGPTPNSAALPAAPRTRHCSAAFAPT